MSPQKQGAGVLVLAADSGRALFAQRAQNVSEPSSWAFWGGMIEPGETPRQAALRELHEETQYDGPIMQFRLIYVYRDRSLFDFAYYNYLLVIPTEFAPKLNWETADAIWTELECIPHPRHYGVEALFGDRQAVGAIELVRHALRRKKR